MSSVKHITEFADLKCGECIYKNYSHCNHPTFEKRKIKHLIITFDGEKAPAFCPLEKLNE